MGDGSLIRATPHENSDIFYGIAGSYGSLGVLVSIEIKLIPAKDFVHLKYHIFSDPADAIKKLRSLTFSGESDFLDGIVFSKESAVVIEGNLQTEENASTKVRFSLKPFYSKYYYQHVKEIASSDGFETYEEIMSHEDYYFRYDRCAFWMGSYLFHSSFLKQFIIQGVL